MEGGEWTPMSKPKRKAIGTSEKRLKGLILSNNFSHSYGTNGVLMTRRSCNGTALLGIVCRRSAESAEVFPATTGSAVFTS